MTIEPTTFEQAHLVDSCEWYIADEIFVKQAHVKYSGTKVPQHAHEHDHITAITAGAFNVWAGDEDLGVYRAPRLLVIKAGVKHRFEALEDNSNFLCIHNITRTGIVEIAEEHQLVEQG